MSRVDVRAIRRKQILEAAERLTVERGWTEISILDICQEAGVSSGVLTYHFHNKDEIMFTLLEEFIVRIYAHLNTAVRDTHTPQEDVSTFLAALSALMEAEPHFPTLLIQFVAASLNRPEIAEKLHGLFRTIRQRRIEEWKSAGVINEPEDEALVLMSMLHVVALGLALGRPFLGIDLPRDIISFSREKRAYSFIYYRERRTACHPPKRRSCLKTDTTLRLFPRSS
jgi:AcrR family transcriptional regulator